MNLDELQAAWQQTNEKIDSIDSQMSAMAHTISATRRSSSLHDLQKRYLRFSIISLAMIPVWGWECFSGILTPTYQLALGIAGMIFFLIASSLDYVLYQKVKAINPISGTVAEVWEQARRCRQLHYISMMILLPIAILLIGSLIYLNMDNRALLYGVVFGVIFGLAIGIRLFLRFMADYRSLRDAE